jgi:serine/threonine protein kinase/tetratricopeptide (TPR) repeat protein
MALTAGTRLGFYEIVEPIGAGGMGEVYRAIDTKLDRQVAVKVLPERLADDPGALARFEREAKAVAALSHPNILAIHDFGSDRGITYAVSELLQGETLGRRLARGRTQWRQAVEIAAAVAEGLSAAHAKGIVHRDLKPDNIFLTTDGQVKILDFGLARSKSAADPDSRSLAPTGTDSGTVMGTPAYMSPEQVKGEKADTPSDLFSFGCVLYEMVTGRRAFSRPTAGETIAAILRDEPPPSATAGHPPELDRVIARCLEKNPAARWQSARDLGFGLKSLLSRTEARQAHPLRLWPVIVAAVVALLLVAVFIAVRGRQPTATAIRSLAVLPLKNLSGDPAQEYFADGMTEALISSLAQIRALKVISRTSVMRYKGTTEPLPEIAGALRVDAIVEGSVQRAGSRVRITAQLIQGATDAHVWAKEYEGDLTDVLRLESEVARAIANEIRIQVTPGERIRLSSAQAVKPEAYEAYLLGRYHQWKLNEEDLQRAIGHFEHAIRIDPNYAAAYAGLAVALPERGVWGTAAFREDEKRAHAAAAKAIELDGDQADGHAALAFIRYHYDWDWSGAEKEFQRALELDPNNWSAHTHYAVMLMALGRFTDAIAQIAAARELDPLSSYIESSYGRILYRARKYEEAIPHLLRASQLDPRDYSAHVRMVDVYIQLGRYPEAIAAEEKARATSGGAVLHWLRLTQVYARMGKRQEALRVLQEAKADKNWGRHVVDTALAYAVLGDKDEAFSWLEKGVERRDLVIFINAEPKCDTLRSDPRFEQLVRRIGLTR